MSLVKNNIQYLHTIYNNDPILLKSYINKFVKIIMQDCSVHQGTLYTVDPVSESIVLIGQINDVFHAKIIVGHSIKNIEVTSDSGLIFPQHILVPQQVADTELVLKRIELTKLFINNRFRVIEKNGILEIEGTLLIEPPYEVENCSCINPIILKRVQNVLSQMSIK